MNFWRFYGEAIARAFHRAWHSGHGTHATIVLLGGALSIFYGVHEENRYFIVAPFLVFAGSFFAGVFWFAYVLYREEHVTRIDLETKISDTSSPGIDPRTQARLIDIKSFIEKGQAITDWLNAPNARNPSPLYAKAVRDLISWSKEMNSFVSTEIPLAYLSFIDPFGFPQLRNHTEVIMFIDRRLQALRSLEAELRNAPATQP
jgi:hypothetical protein